VLERLLDWFAALPPALLYIALAVTAAAENIFPPLPADTVVAFGAFIAARGEASAVLVYVAILAGNLAGAMLMYWVGWKYGSERVMRRLGGSAAHEARLQELHGRYGLGAIAINRFIPGIRAIVPPFAGALRMPPVTTMLALSLASAVWYGLVSYLAFRAGADWESLMARVSGVGRVTAIGAAALVALAALIWWVRRRRRAA
jgi:membrane protein DedA with SNARE-associated domain